MVPPRHEVALLNRWRIARSRAFSAIDTIDINGPFLLRPRLAIESIERALYLIYISGHARDITLILISLSKRDAALYLIFFSIGMLIAA
jgi:hypothetical protein